MNIQALLKSAHSVAARRTQTLKKRYPGCDRVTNETSLRVAVVAMSYIGGPTLSPGCAVVVHEDESETNIPIHPSSPMDIIQGDRIKIVNTDYYYDTQFNVWLPECRVACFCIDGEGSAGDEEETVYISGDKDNNDYRISKGWNLGADVTYSSGTAIPWHPSYATVMGTGVTDIKYSKDGSYFEWTTGDASGGGGPL